MRIGIDAKWFFNGPPSGKHVIVNLVEQMARLKGEHELVVFLDEAEKDRPFPHAGPGVTPAYLWAGNNMLSNVFALPKVAKREGVDVVLFQNFPSLAGSFKKVAYIHDVLFLTHPQFYTWKERLYFAPLRFLANRSDRLITVSETESVRMRGARFNKPIDVAHHGVNPVFRPVEQQDPERIEALRQRFKLPKEFLLFVGRLNVRKNIENLLRGFALVKEPEPLVIVGDRDWKVFDIDALIEELGIADRVIFTGGLFGEDLAGIYSMAKVFCFPSYAESFGMPPLEAMASGVPVVASNATSVPEICGDAALYVNPDSPEEIAAAVDKALGDDKLAKSMRKAGLARAAAFTWEAAARSVLQTLEEAVKTETGQ